MNKALLNAHYHSFSIDIFPFTFIWKQIDIVEENENSLGIKSNPRYTICRYIWGIQILCLSFNFKEIVSLRGDFHDLFLAV